MILHYVSFPAVLVSVILAGCIDSSIYKPAFQWPKTTPAAPDRRREPASHQRSNPVVANRAHTVAQQNTVMRPSFLGSCDYQYNTRELVRLRRPRMQDQVISDGGSWHSGSGLAFGKARLVAQPRADGSLYAWFDLEASSNKFKLYSNTQAFAVFTNSQGDVVLLDTDYRRQSYLFRLSALEMSMSGRTNTKKRKAVLKLSAGCDVSYIMIKFLFCGFQESFGRSNIGSNCARAEFGAFNSRQADGVKLNDIEYLEQVLQRQQLAVGEKKTFPEEALPVAGSNKTFQRSGRWTVMRIR